MHAVVLAKNPQYILCHIRKINDTENFTANTNSAKRKFKVPPPKKRSKRIPLSPLSPND
jgi:hypothetical protein